MRFDVGGIGVDGGAKGYRCLGRGTGSEQIKTALGEYVGSGKVGCGHGFRIKVEGRGIRFISP